MSRIHLFVCAGAIVMQLSVLADTPGAVATLRINGGKITGTVSPMLYGLMTEEINYSYEGGLYGELIRNRSFKASGQEPRFWSAVGNASISLDTNTPLNSSLILAKLLADNHGAERIRASLVWGER